MPCAIATLGTMTDTPGCALETLHAMVSGAGTHTDLELPVRELEERDLNLNPWDK